MLLTSLFISLSLLIFLSVTWYLTLMLFRQQRPHVVIIPVENLHKAAVALDTTPNLPDCTGSGSQFTHNHLVSGWTGTNIVSLLTGIIPFESEVHTRGRSIDQDINTIAG